MRPYVKKDLLIYMLEVVRADGPCSVAHVVADTAVQKPCTKRDLLFTVTELKAYPGRYGLVYDREDDTLELA